MYICHTKIFRMVIPVRRRQLPDLNQTSVIYYKENEYCVINENNQYFIMDNLCPHKEASLGLGKVEGDEIICPLHQYRFNFKTGQCNIERFHSRCYEIEIVEY